MAPEEPGKVVALDFSIVDNRLTAKGEMIIPSDKNLRVSWYAHNVPQNYKAICGGVAYAYEPSILDIQPLTDMRPTQYEGKYSWREPVREDGLMFILILPDNKTIVDPDPIPVEAKSFKKRVALFWLVWPDSETSIGTVSFEWELRDFQGEVDFEVETVNDYIFKSKPHSKTTEYEVALSFAGEDRAYVEKVASVLKAKNVRVFYDKYETVSLWGKNLYDHLSEVYGKISKYTVMFISENYKNKNWTNYERETAQARAFADNREYILPVRFDDTELPGMLKTTTYLSAREFKPEEIAELIIQKLKT